MRNLKFESRNWTFVAGAAFALVALLQAGCAGDGGGYNSLTHSLLNPWTTEQWDAYYNGGGGGAGDGVVEPLGSEDPAVEVPVPVFSPGETNSPFGTIVQRYVGFGWNYVDGTAPDYNGWYGHLSDCEYDIEFSALLWNSYGVDAVYLLTENATRAAIKAMLDAAVAGLPADSVVFVDTSGHGADVGVVAGHTEYEATKQAMAAYDGFMLDYQVWDWLQGVTNRIHFIWRCDTCHSGDMVRAPFVFSRDVPRAFGGSVTLLAGCAKDKTSLSTGRGGMWHRGQWDSTPIWRTAFGWFTASVDLIDPADQAPVYAEYGSVPDWLRDAILVWEEEK